MSRAFSTFYDAILPELRGCSTGMVDYHLLQVARDVCERTGCWWAAFPTITIEPGASTYYLALPEVRAELVRVRELRAGGELLWRFVDPPEPPPGARKEPIERARFPIGAPPFTLSTDREQITLDEAPDGDLDLVGCMQPALNATALPDVLRDQHLETMRLGVLTRLMRMGGKPWTDRLLAADYGTQFERAVIKASNDTAQGNNRPMLRTGKSLF